MIACLLNGFGQLSTEHPIFWIWLGASLQYHLACFSNPLIFYKRVGKSKGMMIQFKSCELDYVIDVDFILHFIIRYMCSGWLTIEDPSIEPSIKAKGSLILPL